jgi:hypothetical protein
MSAVSGYPLIDWAEARARVSGILGVLVDEIDPDTLIESAKRRGRQVEMVPAPHLETWTGSCEDALAEVCDGTLQLGVSTVVVTDDAFALGGPFLVEDGDLAALAAWHAERERALFDCGDLIIATGDRLFVYHHGGYVFRIGTTTD